MTITIASSGLITNDVTIGSGETLQIVGGDVFTSTTIEGGGELNVNGSAATVSAMVDSGALLFVNQGGSADATIIFDGATDEDIGFESDAVVQANGVQSISQGGEATDTLVEDGGTQIIEGQLFGTTQHVVATASDTTIEAGGFEVVSAFGTAIGSEIDSGGFVELLHDGTLDGATIHAGGAVFQQAGALTNLTVESGGTLLIIPGLAQQANLTIDPGAVVISTGVIALLPIGQTDGLDPVSRTIAANDGSLVVSPDVGAGAQLFVLPGGTVSGATLVVPGTPLVVDGGRAIGTTLLDGEMDIQSGEATDTTVETVLGGLFGAQPVELVEPGAEDQTALIRLGGQQIVEGKTDDDVVSAGGTQTATGPGYASATTVFAEGLLQAMADGEAARFLILSGGLLAVLAGGSATDGSVNAGGLELVYSGGEDDESFVETGGVQIVESGGISKDGYVTGGSKTVGSGGYATTELVFSGGVETVDAGGTIDGVTIEDGGTLVVAGSVDNVTVDPGGREIFTGDISVAILTGQTVFGAYLVDARAAVSAGGIASAVTVGSAATLTVSNGGLAQFDILSGLPAVNFGGALQQIMLGGTAVGTDIEAAGGEYIMSGGVARQGTVESAGQQSIGAYGSSYSATIMFGGRQEVGGFAYDAMVASGGIQSIDTQGVASNSIVSSGGQQDVQSGSAEFDMPGGMAVSANLLAGAMQVVAASAISEFTYLNSNAVEYNLGTAIGTTISNGGTLSEGGLQLEGESSSSHILSGGLEYVGAEGRTTSAFIDNGGTQLILPEAISVAATVANGGTLISIEGTIYDATIAAGGQEILEGGVLSGSTTLAAGALLVNSTGMTVRDGTVTIGGTFDNLAYAELDPSEMSVGDLIGIGTIGIDAGSTLEVTGSASAGQTIAFTDDSGLFRTDVLADMQAMIAGFTIGDTIDIAGLAYDPDGHVDPAGDTGILTIHAGGQAYELDLVGDYTGATFALTSGSDGGTVLTQAAPCFAAGSRIATPDGPVPVENLTVGGTILTTSGAVRVIRWIGTRSYDGRFIAGNRNILPIVFRAGSLADGVPARDLSVSPKHAMFLDGVLIPAELLVNGVSVVQMKKVATLAYFHIELADHDILVAEGAPCESFIDHDSRALFHNAGEYLAPAGATRARDCATRVEDGKTLDTVRRRLACRAGLVTDHVDDAMQDGPIDGRIDVMNRQEISGWAFDATRPHTPVRLEILVDGSLVATILANGYRDDLRLAGLGDGRCAYVYRPLLTFGAHPTFVAVRRATDGALLPVPDALRVACVS